jgi:hypothetical protein
MKLRTIACAMAAAMVSALFLGPHAAADSVSASSFSPISITGTFVGGTFAGTLDIERFTTTSGKLVAVGTVNGTFIAERGAMRSVSNVPGRLPLTSVSVRGQQQAQQSPSPFRPQEPTETSAQWLARVRAALPPGGAPAGPLASVPGTQQDDERCVLHLEVRGLTLSLLGIEVSLSPFTLDLTLDVPGGGLLGELCALLGVLGGRAPAAAQASLLNQALHLTR